MKPTKLHIYIAIVAVVLSASCSLNVQQRHRSAVYSSKELTVTPDQIRLRMRSLVEPFVGEIEQAADEIAAGTADISVKRAAIRWKIEGVPALRTALFQPNPFTAVLDVWVLTYQMANYFESGPGRRELGPAAARAVSACLRLEEELNQIVATFTVSRDVTIVRNAARTWALDNPIRYAIRNRETTLSRVTEQDVGVEWGAAEYIAEAVITADDIHREIQIYSDHLFRQARWETDLLKLDLLTSGVSPLAERAVRSSERAAETFEDLAHTVKTTTSDAAEAAKKFALDASKMVTAERNVVVETINTNLQDTLMFLQGERIASLEHISSERSAILQQLQEERVAATRDLGEIMVQERAAFSREIEQAELRIVDHAAWRVFQLGAILLGLLFLAGILFLLVIRRFLLSSRQSQQVDRNPPRAA